MTNTPEHRTAPETSNEASQGTSGAERVQSAGQMCSQNMLEQDEHAAAVSHLFSDITPWYDFLNHFLSMELDRTWRHFLARSVFPHDEDGGGKLVLDLAAGTLDVSFCLRRYYPKVGVMGLDLCPNMLLRGKHKLKSGNREAIVLTACDARRIPVRDACAHGVTMAFGIRNISPREEAFAEMYRVLVPGGRACILEFGTGKKRIWCGLYNFYLNRILPGLGRVSGSRPAYEYLARTIREFPSSDTLCAEMHSVGFERAYAVPLCSGIVHVYIAEKAKQGNQV